MTNVAQVLLTSLAVTTLAALAGCSRTESAAFGQPGNAREAGAGQDKPVRIKVVRPTREHLKRTTAQPAHVEPYEKTDLFAKVAGYLHKLGQVRGPDGTLRDVDIGDRVEKDQLLAELSVPEVEQDRVQKEALVEQAQSEVVQAEAAQQAAEALVGAFRARIEQARSELARYAADLEFRRIEHERFQRLVQERAVQKDLADEKLNQVRAAEASFTAAKAAITTAEANHKVEQARLAKARADVVSAQARLKVAAANLKQAVILLEYSRIRAPFAGVLTRRLVDTGAFVQSAALGKPEPLFTLVRVDRMRIVTDIPESEAGWVKLGQPAVLLVDATRGQHYAGKVVRFADALDTATRTMRTEVELAAPATGLRPGMFGSVTLTLADYPDALLLPTNALVAGVKPSVLIVEEGKVRQREIEVGSNDGIRIHVTRGLTGAEQVITDGKNLVREGQAVEIAP